MTRYVGIDLGTTNSAIASYDGTTLRIHKSPEQNAVTPSAIYIDARSRYYGAPAYRQAAFRPGNTAVLFKRLMGTCTPITLSALQMSLSPEECSAELLKVLYGYLGADDRNDLQGTVITVPAAFNQMQKDATQAAAEQAGIGRVALMQEPVAAVMSAMRTDPADGIFLVYDLGGGTFDIALAESQERRVTIREHDGIPMNGGRDWDRRIVDTLVLPWLREHFNLPEHFSPQDPVYGKLRRLAEWAAEQAKIRLAQSDAAQERIVLNEDEVRLQDRNGREMYLDVALPRSELDRLIEPLLQDTLHVTHTMLERSGYAGHDIARIVFIGGPTQYPPLRERVCFELGIAGDTRTDPMTAVAEGAAVFAEALDWDDPLRTRKNPRASAALSQTIDLRFDYLARTPKDSVPIKMVCSNPPPGMKVQIDHVDTGTSYGQIALQDGTTLLLRLPRQGEHTFKVFLFDASGQAMPLQQDRLLITRTAVSIDAIPASHSIGVELRDGIGSKTTHLDILIHKGERLPARRQRVRFLAGDSVRAGSDQALYFYLYQGDIEHPVSDNLCIGCLKITGRDFDYGVIQPGDELLCDVTMNDAGHIALTVSIPAVTGRLRRQFLFTSGGATRLRQRRHAASARRSPPANPATGQRTDRQDPGCAIDQRACQTARCPAAASRQ